MRFAANPRISKFANRLLGSGEFQIRSGIGWSAICSESADLRTAVVERAIRSDSANLGFRETVRRSEQITHRHRVGTVCESQQIPECSTWNRLVSYCESSIWNQRFAAKGENRVISEPLRSDPLANTIRKFANSAIRCEWLTGRFAQVGDPRSGPFANSLQIAHVTDLYEWHAPRESLIRRHHLNGSLIGVYESAICSELGNGPLRGSPTPRNRRRRSGQSAIRTESLSWRIRELRIVFAKGSILPRFADVGEPTIRTIADVEAANQRFAPKLGIGKYANRRGRTSESAVRMESASSGPISESPT